MTPADQDYGYGDAFLEHSHAYLLPRLAQTLDQVNPQRVFEVGCGNGAVANWLSQRGIEVTGIDISPSGIEQANLAYPHVQLSVGTAYDDLAARHGTFPLVMSLEVVEHLYFPRKFAATVFGLLEPGGTAVISTPYHGYWKNLALAVTGKYDFHFTALWDGGHIKFWSIATLTTLLAEAGFEQIRFYRIGRIPPLAKSMIAVARRPSAPT